YAKGKWIPVQHWTWWRSGPTSNGRVEDLATLKLAQPTTGYIFDFRKSPVRIGMNLAMVGHPLGNKVSLTQGRVIARKVIQSVPLLAVNLLGAEGASGSAFVDDDGLVVGVLQAGLGSKDV